MRVPPAYFLVVMALPGAAQVQNPGASVREGRLTLSTYDEGPPDPNPPFAAFSGRPFPLYPYRVRSAAGQLAQKVQWRVLTLENEYLSCRVLPDLGGHLHGCTDKITGREIFYSNPAVRNGLGDLRPFIPTGIESSFPITHSRVSGAPVDFADSDHEGVARVVVEDTDLVSGMRWRVQFILRPGSAVLEQHVTLHNGSLMRRFFQWWTDAAIELDDPHLRFVYPTKWMLPHGAGDMMSWPVTASGRDLSDAANYRTQAGLFALGSREPWMAVYKPASQSGIVHYADPNQVRGKKLWLGGYEDTLIKTRLTENFNSFVEMQAGLFETQDQFASLLPQESKAFAHYWIPFHGLGGVSRATRDAVLNLERADRDVRVELLATHIIRGAQLRFSHGSDVIFQEQADLDPRSVYAKNLKAAPSPLIVDVADSSGAVLLHHVEGQMEALSLDGKAANAQPSPASESADAESAILARGSDYESRDRLGQAWNEYRSALDKHPGSAALAAAAGRAAFSLNRYDEAIPLLARMADSDAETSYYCGTALARTGKNKEAETALERASREARWAPAARLQLALLAARDGHIENAASLIQELTSDPQAAPRTGAFEVAILRRAGKRDAAGARLRFWRERDPADNALRFEQTLLTAGEDAALWSHLAADPERVLDLADLYFQLGAYDDALKLLERRYPAVPANEAEPGNVLPQDHPLVAYYRGFCRLKLGQDSGADFRAASALPTLYVFPHRDSSFPVLEAALARNDADPVAHALLGDLFFDSFRTDQAIAEWRKALALRPDLPALPRNLGKALLDIKRDPVAALPVLRKGHTLNPEDREIAEALTRVGKAVADVPLPPEAGNQLAARALVRAALDPDGARAVFTALNFPKDKQPDLVRRAYIEAQLQRLLVRSHQGKCDEVLAALERLDSEDKNLPFTFYGFAPFIKAPHFQFYVGVIEDTCGEKNAARKTWSKLRKLDLSDPVESVFPYLAGRALTESDAQPRIAAAVETLQRSLAADSSRMDLIFALGSLQMAAGHGDEASAMLAQAAQAPDPLIRYLSLVALRENPAR